MNAKLGDKERKEKRKRKRKKERTEDRETKCSDESKQTREKE